MKKQCSTCMHFSNNHCWLHDVEVWESFKCDNWLENKK